MIVTKHHIYLAQNIEQARKTGKKIAFVPTMGALHDGHLTLVREARKIADFVIVSIFVNPTQFNNAQDLKNYPRTIANDLQSLLSVKCDLAYIPSKEEIYPQGDDLSKPYPLGSLEHELEGAFRPGHFQGVAQVVHRLLDLVQPDYLVMGQKDFQQLAVIRQLLKHISSKAVLVPVPTVRERTGLAMSSRNRRLSVFGQKKASAIHEVLQLARKHYKFEKIEKLETAALKELRANGLKPEYFSILDAETLQPVKNNNSHPVIAVTAVWLEGVRLIDNMILQE